MYNYISRSEGVNMKNDFGEDIKNEDAVIAYPRRLEKKENYEIWSHPFVFKGTVTNSFDLQLVYFSKDGTVYSYHVSDNENHFKDVRHIEKLQLVYHDIALEFYEHTHLVKDIWSQEPKNYFNQIIESRMKKDDIDIANK